MPYLSVVTVVCIALFSLVTVIHSSCNHSGHKIDYLGTLGSNIVKRSSLKDCPRNVTEIDLRNNSIIRIDNDTFIDFYQVITIRLDFNQIPQLPSGLLHFRWGLTFFSVSYNSLTELPDDLFRDNPDLTTFIANNNNISFIGNKVFHRDLTKLNHVNLSYNALTAFEPWPYVTNYGKIGGDDFEFDLQHNFISEFSNTLNWTYNLVHPFDYKVYLQNNRISNLSTSIIYMYHPDYTGSTLTELFSYEMNLTVNPYYCDCLMYPYVHDLYDSFFLYFRVEEYRYYCDGPPHLKGVDGLHDVDLNDFVCHVTDNCPKGCSCVERPHINQLVVNCTSVGLTSLPDILPAPMTDDRLITLILDYNRISHFNTRNYTAKLLNVSLSYNNVNYIDSDTISLMKKIEKFDVSHNRLSYLPQTMQFLAFDNIKISNNVWQCSCNMTWMADWIALSPNAEDYNVKCSDDDERHLIREVTENLLLCSYEGIAIGVSIGLGSLIAIIIGIVITAKRCPYETKVLMYKFLGIHPGDKYKVDDEDNRSYDIYMSHDPEDIQARQWVKTVFLRKLEEGNKRRYKVFTPMRDTLPANNYADELVGNMRRSRRIIFLVTESFLQNEWNCYESDQAELEHYSSENLQGRVIYILWNKSVWDKLTDEPWKARMEGKRVLCPDDRFFWSKIRYELPLKPLAR